MKVIKSLNKNRHFKMSVVYFLSVMAVCFCFFISAKNTQAAAPTVTAFSLPANSTSTTVLITELSATDDDINIISSEVLGGASGQDWYSSAVSADGSTIIAGSLVGLYISTTSNNWAEVQPSGAPAGFWLSSAMSADGLTMIAGVYGGRLYIHYYRGHLGRGSAGGK